MPSFRRSHKFIFGKRNAVDLLSEEVTEERDILLSKRRKNKKKVAAVKGDIQELS